MSRTLSTLFWLFISVVNGQQVLAQYYYNGKNYSSDWIVELGGSVGVMNCLTDLGGNKGQGKKFITDLNWSMTKPGCSFFAVAMFKDAIGARVEASIGNVHSYDSVLRGVAPSTLGRYERNLSFRSPIKEMQLCAEVHPVFFKRYDQDQAPYWSPYLVAGIGYFSFNPQAYLNNKWYDLHPLHTEGQGFEEYRDRKPYRLHQIDLPVGLGLRYELSSALNARLEMIYRILFTDYLDDVSERDYVDPSLFKNYFSPQQASLARQLADRRLTPTNNVQRGNPNNNDAFLTIQFKISVGLRPGKRNQ